MPLPGAPLLPSPLLLPRGRLLPRMLRPLLALGLLNPLLLRSLLNLFGSLMLCLLLPRLLRPLLLQLLPRLLRPLLLRLLPRLLHPLLLRLLPGLLHPLLLRLLPGLLRPLLLRLLLLLLWALFFFCCAYAGTSIPKSRIRAAVLAARMTCMVIISLRSLLVAGSTTASPSRAGRASFSCRTNPGSPVRSKRTGRGSGLLVLGFMSDDGIPNGCATRTDSYHRRISCDLAYHFGNCYVVMRCMSRAATVWLSWLGGSAPRAALCGAPAAGWN